MSLIEDKSPDTTPTTKKRTKSCIQHVRQKLEKLYKYSGSTSNIKQPDNKDKLMEKTYSYLKNISTELNASGQKKDKIYQSIDQKTSKKEIQKDTLRNKSSIDPKMYKQPSFVYSSWTVLEKFAWAHPLPTTSTAKAALVQGIRERRQWKDLRIAKAARNISSSDLLQVLGNSNRSQLTIKEQAKILLDKLEILGITTTNLMKAGLRRIDVVPLVFEFRHLAQHGIPCRDLFRYGITCCQLKDIGINCTELESGIHLSHLKCLGLNENILRQAAISHNDLKLFGVKIDPSHGNRNENFYLFQNPMTDVINDWSTYGEYLLGQLKNWIF